MRFILCAALACTLMLTATNNASAWNRREAMRVNAQHLAALRVPAYNLITRQYAARQGNTVMTSRGEIWCSLPIYAGPGYAIVPSRIGPTVVRVDKERYGAIYKDLVSQDDERIENALNLIDGSAYMQGLIDLPPSSGD